MANRVAKEDLDVVVEVDGGIDAETAKQAVSAGATALVAGTAAFRGGPSSYAENIRALRGAG
jgi:ribulose-phosphate 3-epimerase